MAPKGGIRKRLGLSTSSDGGQPASSSSGSWGGAEAAVTVPEPRRGGIRRRIQEGTAGVANEDADQPLLKSLKRRWAEGKISSPLVQEFAQGAVAQGAHGMEAVAAIAQKGRNPQNLQRDLQRTFGLPKGAPDVFWAVIPTSGGNAFHPFYLPHAMFASLFKHSAKIWEAAVEGAEGAAYEFWSSSANTDFVRHHPVLTRRLWPLTIPLGFHGDAGAFSKQDSLFTFTWNSLLGEGTTMRKRFLITVIKKDQVSPKTLDAIFEIVAWSFNVLLTRLTPETDFQSRPMPNGGIYLAQKWRGALMHVRGDWEFYCSVFKFPYWNEALNMCWLCHASGTPGPNAFTSCGPDASWRTTRRTHESYLAELSVAGRRVPVLLARIVGLRLSSIMIDVLHCVDQGVASHIVGNIFWECILAKVWGGATHDQNVKGLMNAMQAHYKASSNAGPLFIWGRRRVVS